MSFKKSFNSFVFGDITYTCDDPIDSRIVQKTLADSLKYHPFLGFMNMSVLDSNGFFRMFDGLMPGQHNVLEIIWIYESVD